MMFSLWPHKARAPVLGAVELNRTSRLAYGLHQVWLPWDAGGLTIRDLVRGDIGTITGITASAIWGRMGTHGTANTGRPIPIGRSWNFSNTSNQYISIPMFDPSAVSGFSIFLWAKINSNNNDDCLLSQEDGTGTGRPWMARDNGGVVDDEMYTVIGGSKLSSANKIMPADSTWHMYGITYNGTTNALRMLADGVVTDTHNSVTPESATGNVRIGTTKGGGDPLDGSIGPIYIWSRVLDSATETQLLYSTPYDMLRLKGPIVHGLPPAAAATTSIYPHFSNLGVYS